MQRALFVYVWATWYEIRRSELAGNHNLESYQGSADLVLAVHLLVDDDDGQTFLSSCIVNGCFLSKMRFVHLDIAPPMNVPHHFPKKHPTWRRAAGSMHYSHDGCKVC